MNKDHQISLKQRTFLVLVIACTLVFSANAAMAQSSAATAEPELLYSDRPATWIMAQFAGLRVSSDGDWAAFGSGRWLRLVDLTTGQENQAKLAGSMQNVSALAFPGGEALVRRGNEGEQKGWFVSGDSAPAFPPGAVPTWSPNGESVAYYMRGQAKVFFGSSEDPKHFELTGKITGLEWTHDGAGVFVILLQPSGASSLVRLDSRDGMVESIATGLDASTSTGRRNSFGVSPDGKSVYLALASDGVPDDEARHDIDSRPDLDIYQLNLASGALQLVVATPIEEFAPTIAGDYLYWTSVNISDSSVVLPSGGGQAHTVFEGSQIPYWSTDGRQIAVTVGTISAISMDVRVVDLDQNAQPISEPRDLIAGYHEDFTPAWSPDGKWMAFHSHRTLSAVPLYRGVPGEEVPDDLYLLRVGSPINEEKRLTDFGWEQGLADWAPDSRRLVVTSWEKGGKPGIALLWIITIDPETGESIAFENLGMPAPLTNTRMAVWSPVSEEIAIENDDGNGRQSIWIMNLETRDMDKVVEYESTTYTGLDWTPDGSTIVYSAVQDGRMQIFSVPRSGGQAKKLSDDSGNLLQPQVSPDGKWIAAGRMILDRQLWRMKL